MSPAARRTRRRSSRVRRVLSAALGTALLWATVWAIVGVLASPYTRALAHAAPARSFLDYLFDAAWVGWYGLLAGLVFAVVLAVAARRRTFAELTVARMTAWAVGSSMLLTLPPTALMIAARPEGWRAEDGVYLGASVVLSLVCALGSLLLARSAQRPRR